jgi:hypothetical protein
VNSILKIIKQYLTILKIFIQNAIYFINKNIVFINTLQDYQQSIRLFKNQSVGNICFRIIGIRVLRTNLTDWIITKTEELTIPNFQSYVVENVAHISSFNIVSYIEVCSVNMNRLFL